jgi:GH24 family phage-related lysozyme (muramidase)
MQPSGVSAVADYVRSIFKQQVDADTSIAASAKSIPFDPSVDDIDSLVASGYNPEDVLKASIATGSASATGRRSIRSETMDDLERLVRETQEARKPKTTRRSVSSQVLDMLATELNRGMTSKQTDIQPTVSADSSRDRFELQGEMRDLPVLDDEDAPSVDTLSNEALDKELPSAGLGSRPVAEEQTDDDMGITDIPTFGVGSRKFNSSVVDEMVSLEGMGGDDLSATPTYSYGITKEKADEYNLVPSNYKTMREFADAFADKYVEEKYEANKSIFDNVDKEFHKPLMSYLWNAGSFGRNQRKALNKKNPDVREFIKEMRDAIHSEGFASSGLSARRAKEANLLGEGLANWEDIVKVEVSGTKEKPVFKWVTASGNVVEEFASGKKLHPNNKLSDVTL